MLFNVGDGYEDRVADVELCGGQKNGSLVGGRRGSLQSELS